MIEGETAHYLLRVLRLTVDKSIHLFNGEGGYYLANVAGMDKRSLSVMPVKFIKEEKESNLRLTLAQGISRGQKMDYTIQKSVELGVSCIVPVMTEFSNVKLTDERATGRVLHWKKIIISACEQCGRNRIPEILGPVPLKEWVEQDSSRIKLVLDPEAERTLSDVSGPDTGVTLLSGPEGGLSEHDLEEIFSAGYQAVRLGPRTLRTETAAVAAIAACQSLWGDMR